MNNKLFEIEFEDDIEERKECYLVFTNKNISDVIFFDEQILPKFLKFGKKNINVFTKFNFSRKRFVNASY